MTMPLAGLGPLERLSRIPAPVFGFDPGTRRFAAGVLKPERPPISPMKPWPVPRVYAETVTLKQHDELPFRQVLAVDVLVGWLRELDARYGRPGLIGLEVPMGNKVKLEFFYVLGAFLVAVGQVWGAGIPVRDLNPGEWKATATGHGIAPGAPRAKKGATVAEKRAADKARREGELGRILEWAQHLGYSGESFDEAAGIGVAVAVALKATR
jgi:hypothetical protein